MTCPIKFDVDHIDRSTGARVGRLTLARGVVDTPTFMPVGTQAAVRSLPPRYIRETGSGIVLSNTYHLHQRPGADLIAKMGGLHRFMGTDLPILTDSGGFQVFSLDKKQVDEEGVRFTYEVDGRSTFLSPEISMGIQEQLGSDIAMAFDECLEPSATRERTDSSLEMTSRWAERCLQAHNRPDQSLFGIVQGGMFDDLRARSASQICSLPFDGFAIGGLSVGEGPELMNKMLAMTTPLMPAHLPRYLMGVGRPQDLVDGVALGVDMFDCVIPTRHARSGTVYTFQGRMRLTHARYRKDAYPIDSSCTCYTCRTFSRAYLYHLFSVGEVLSSTLCTIHNLTFFATLMARIREAVKTGRFAEYRKDIKALYPEKTGAERTADTATAQMDVRKKFSSYAKPRTPDAVAGNTGVRRPRADAGASGSGAEPTRGARRGAPRVDERTGGRKPKIRDTTRKPRSAGPTGGKRGGKRGKR